MLRARPLRAASAALRAAARSAAAARQRAISAALHLSAATVAPPPPPAAPPTYETSHQFREKSHPLKSLTAPAVLLFLLAPVFLVLLAPTPAHAQAKGATCPVNGYTAAATQATGGQNLVCSSLAWAYVPYQFGASAGTCPGASNVNLGIIQWTGSAFQGCTASGWGSLASGGAAALSALTAATTTNSINNVNFAQTWTWGTLGSNTALTLTSTGMTTGTLLNLSNTDTAANAGKVLIVSNSEGGNSTGISSTMLSATNTGYAGYFSNVTTNAGYAVYGTMTAHGNTGYAGYFINTDTSTNVNYGVAGYVSSTTTTGTNPAGVYGEGDCSDCTGVNGYSSSGTGAVFVGGFRGIYAQSNSTSNGNAVYGTMTATNNTGYAGYFINTDTSNSTNYGVYGSVAGTGSSQSAGVYGQGNCAASDTCYGVYGNSGNIGVVGNGTYAAVYAVGNGTGADYGVYGSITGHGNTGYAGYFKNTDTSSNNNYGVYSIISSTTTTGNGSDAVYGEADCVNCYGIYGSSNNGTGVGASSQTSDAIVGSTFGNTNYTVAVLGLNYSTTAVLTAGVQGQSTSTTSGQGVNGSITGASNYGYGVYGQNSGHSNTGYAGYFINTDTSTSTNYGVYGQCNGTGTCAGVYGFSANNVGVSAVGANFGIYAVSGSTGGGIGVYGTENGTTNTGYAGFFSNTGTGAVNYGLYATTSSSTGWAGYFNGNIYLNGTITLSSDRRMKKDIEPLDTGDALDEITALRPVAFTWKKTGVEDMGLIAQEVDLVYPDLVTHSGADETLALKYTSLIAPMIASIQELKKRADQLEIENATLRRDFNTYKATHP
jgi:hypothetical protein